MGHTSFQSEGGIDMDPRLGSSFNCYLDTLECYGQFHTKLLPHAPFNISIMMLKSCAINTPTVFYIHSPIYLLNGECK